MTKFMPALAAALLLAVTAANPAVAQTAQPAKKPAAAAPAAPAAPAANQPSAAQKAQQDKMKSCAAEWQAMKKAGKTKGTTYQQFSSECLKKS
jgi:Skp family chaperone for outer membrane proteins